MAEITVVSVVQILKNYSSNESSSSDEEYESLQEKKNVLSVFARKLCIDCYLTLYEL